MSNITIRKTRLKSGKKSVGIFMANYCTCTLDNLINSPGKDELGNSMIVMVIRGISEIEVQSTKTFLKGVILFYGFLVFVLNMCRIFVAIKDFFLQIVLLVCMSISH